MKKLIEIFLEHSECPKCKGRGGMTRDNIEISSDYSFITLRCRCLNVDCRKEFEVYYKPYDINLDV